MEWILVTGYTFLFIYLILKLPAFEAAGISRKWFAAVFVLKVIAGISLGLIYTYYYPDRSTADTFKFFDDSNVIFRSLFHKPWDFVRMFSGYKANDPELRSYYLQMNAWLNTDVMFNDNKTIIRLNVLFRFLSLGKYYVHVVFINFFSFTGLFCIYKTFRRYLPTSGRELFAGTFLLPSVLFWGSGLLKDGLLLFALGILVLNFSHLTDDGLKRRNILFFLMSLLLLIFTKLYVIIAIFPGLIAWYLSRKTSGWKALMKFSLIYLIYFVIVFNIHYILPRYKVSDIIYWKQQNFYTLADMTNARSIIEIPALSPGALSIILNAPSAFLTTLTRPFLNDVKGNPLILLSALETILILCTGILALYYRKKDVPRASPFLIFSIFFVLMMFILSGLITPILGALVRYKVPALPFLIFIFLTIADFKSGKRALHKEID